MARVVVLGSCNTDLCVRLPKLPGAGETVLGGPFSSGPGGKGANQAVAARRAGAEVVFLTAVGDDAFGRDALDRYEREGIDVSLVRVHRGVASGVALIFVAEGGENLIGVAPGANALLSADDVDALPAAVFELGAVLLASLEVPLETVARALVRARRAGMTTVLNPAPAHRGLASGPEAELLRHVDWLTPNRSEAVALSGLDPSSESERAAAVALRERFGIAHVVVTRGADGCLLATNEGIVELAAFSVRAVDTVGAGDAFSGALAAAVARRLPVREAVVWANAAGALAVTQHGAQAASPAREEIERLAARSDPTEASHTIRVRNP